MHGARVTMDSQRQEKIFVVVAPGLEMVCAAELAELGLAGAEVVAGGVEFQGRLADLYRANLCLRTASRVVVRLARFRCRDFPELYRSAIRLPWGRFLRPGTSPDFRVTCRTSRLMHSDRVATTLQAAVMHALGETEPVAGRPGQLVLVRIVDDEVVLSIDSSGEHLHRRGYRTAVAAAPLRETLAAGCLRLLGWNGSQPFADPLCGTGTFLLEAAMLAGRRAPGLAREFAFMHWPGYRPGLWQALCAEVRRQERPAPVLLCGGDADAAALAAARANLERLDPGHGVELLHLPLERQAVHPGEGLVLCNPPYGKRLLAGVPLAPYFTELGRELQRAYPAWRKALLLPDPQLARASGLPLKEVAVLDNGGLRVWLFATPARAGKG